MLFKNQKEKPHKLLSCTDILKYTIWDKDTREDEVTERSVIDIMNLIFVSNYNKKEMAEFLDEYEFLYDEKRQYVLLIIRGVRLRVRKYYYLPPVYVAFNLKNESAFAIQPQKLRYFQKLEFYGITMEKDITDAYNLSKNPFQVAYHPHIDSSGHACLGDWGANLNTARDGSPYAYVETLRGYLNDYNGRSTFFRINPYIFDRRDNPNQKIQFPYNQSNIIRQHTTNALVTDELLRKHISKDWFIDMCEENQLNYSLYSKIWALMCIIMEGENSYKNALITLLHDEGIECPYDRVPEYPDYEKVSGEDYQIQYTVWREFNEWMNENWSPEAMSSFIYKYLYMLLGYEISKGDIFMYNHAMSSYHINFEYDVETYKKIRNIKEHNITFYNTFRMTVDNDISYANFEYLMNLITFIKSESLTNHMDEFYKWSNALLDVSPKNKWEELSREWNKATRVNYDRLASDGLIYNSNVEVGENSIWMGEDEYKWKQEFPTFSIHASFTVQISRILNNKIKSANSTISKEQGIMFIESMHKKTKWEKKFKKTKASTEELFEIAINELFLEGNGLRDVSHSTSTQLYLFKAIENSWDEDELGFNTLSEIAENNKIYYEAMLSGSNSLEPKEVKRVFFKCFPKFEQSINDTSELCYQIDKKLVLYAYRLKHDSLTKQLKELNNVIKSSVRNIQQSELFPEEISIN